MDCVAMKTDFPTYFEIYTWKSQKEVILPFILTCNFVLNKVSLFNLCLSLCLSLFTTSLVYFLP